MGKDGSEACFVRNKKAFKSCGSSCQHLLDKVKILLKRKGVCAFTNGGIQRQIRLFKKHDAYIASMLSDTLPLASYIVRK